MTWSFPIARLWGSEVRLHLTFFLVFIFGGTLGWITGHTWSHVGCGILTMIGLFTSVLLHEYGHALAGKLFGIRTPVILLLPVGGIAKMDGMPEKPWQEMVVAVAGPMVNVAIFAALVLWKLELIQALFAETEEKNIDQYFKPFTLASLPLSLAAANLILILFNMLPAFPMDGGRVLRAFLSMMMDRLLATKIAVGIGRLFAICWVILGASAPFWPNTVIHHPHPIALVGVFIFYLGSKELNNVRLMKAIEGKAVEEIMNHDIVVCSLETPIGDGLHELAQKVDLQLNDQLVVSDDHFLGILTKRELMAGAKRHGEAAPIATIAERAPARIYAAESLLTVLPLFSIHRVTALPVVDQVGGPIIGILPAQRITKLAKGK